MKEKIINFLKLSLLLILFFNLSMWLRLGLEFIGIEPSMFGYVDTTYFSCLVDCILVIILIILYEKTFSKDWYLFKNKFDFKEFLIYLSVFFGVKIGASIITFIVSLIVGTDLLVSENQSIIETLAAASPLVMIISSVFLAPILEEGIFRLGFRKLFKNNYLYIILSGFIFGLMHIFPTDLSLSIALTQGITYVAIGVLLSTTYVKTNNIWFVICLHAANNLIGMLAIL